MMGNARVVYEVISLMEMVDRKQVFTVELRATK